MNDERPKEASGTNKLMSIDDYLNAVDWRFHDYSLQGEHGSFHWILLRIHALFQELIPPPNGPYRILVTDWDHSDETARIYAKTAGWSAIDQFAISELNTGPFPEINNHADTAFVCLEQGVTDDDIRDALPYADKEPRFDYEDSWSFLEKLRPYLYVQLADYTYCASENKQLLDLLQTSEVLAEAEQYHLAKEKSHRRGQWETMGSELGTEKCIEQECDNLRIRLAVRCFLHQKKAFGGLASIPPFI
ncbi:MAG: hypothetical protein P4L53_01385 [Candidatus Obscuribacterales bacterium]|nr:hypothetical protein [Candidatus Obscuribacterales bacterium]